MKIIGRSTDGVTLFLTNDEVLILSNALNEIANGIEISEFESRIGFPEEFVSKVMADFQEALFRADRPT